MEYITQLNSLIEKNQFLSGGLVLGLLTAIFVALKPLPLILWNKFKFNFSYKIYLDQNDEVYNIFAEWFQESFPKKFRNVEVRFTRIKTEDEGRRGKTKRGWKLWKYQNIDTNFIWYKKRLLWISKEKKELESAKDIFSMFHNSYNISGLFAKNAIDDLCEELINKKIQQEGGNPISVFSYRWSDFQRTKGNLIKSFDNIFFKQKELYLKDLNRFINAEKFYKDKEINYKRAYLFHGPGGTGKSSIAGATAKYLQYDLYTINLNGFNDDGDFINASSKIPPESVILFEDVDCFLKGRDIKNDKVSFSTLLNVMDGLYAPSNCIFILTTNKLEELDEALVRKGRIDLTLHLDYPDAKEIQNFMSKFYDSKVKISNKKFNCPMSNIQEICINNSKVDAIKKIEEICK